MGSATLAARLAAAALGAVVVVGVTAPVVVADKPEGSDNRGRSHSDKSSGESDRSSRRSDKSSGDSDRSSGRSGDAPGQQDKGGGQDPGGGSGGGDGSTTPAPGTGAGAQPTVPAPSEPAGETGRPASSGSGYTEPVSGDAETPSSPPSAAARQPAPTSASRRSTRESAPSSPQSANRVGDPRGAGKRPGQASGRRAAAAAGSPRAEASASRAGRSKRPAKTEATEPSLVPRVVRKVIEVVPAPIKAALLIMAGLLLTVGGGAALNARRARRMRDQRAELMEEVGVLQTALLPEVPAHIGQLWISAAYRPADGPTAGGNFYDVFKLNEDAVGVVVGDVSGQGRERLADSTLARHTLRHYLKAGHPPAQALALARPRLQEDLAGELRTVVLASFDPGTGTLVSATLGESVLLILDGEGSEAATAITVDDAPEATARLPVGSRACLFTSGLGEARLEGSMLGREGVRAVAANLGADLTAESLLEGVAARARSLPSDLAACVLEPDDDPALLSEPTPDGREAPAVSG